MNKILAIPWAAACFALLPTGPAVATASCFDAQANIGPNDTSLCVDYFFDRVNLEIVTLEKAATGVTSADINVFDNPALIPGNIVNLHSGAWLMTDGPANGASSFYLKQTLVNRITPDIDAYSGLFAVTGSSAQVSFTPQHPSSTIVPVDLRVHVDFVIDDPLDLASLGQVEGGSSFSLSGPGTFEFDSGFFIYDSLNSSPELFGMFDVSGIVMDGPTPGSKTLTLDVMMNLDLATNQPHTFNANTFGAIFSDGFESGDTSAWSSSSPDSAVFEFSSTDPLVTFNVVVPVPAALWLFASALGLLGWVKRRAV